MGIRIPVLAEAFFGGFFPEASVRGERESIDAYWTTTDRKICKSVSGNVLVLRKKFHRIKQMFINNFTKIRNTIFTIRKDFLPYLIH